MEVFLLYLVKVSISLGIMYLFYQLVLRKLTFYQYNRWFLFGYSVTSFFIPFFDINAVLSHYESLNHHVFVYIPSIESFTLDNIHAFEGDLNGWLVLVVLLALGSLSLLVKLIVQFVSYKRIKEKAIFLSGNLIKFYQVNQDITPFSFGRAIFLNSSRHSEAELKDIIEHELVHIRQKHGIDIIWGEILCILNWYNPFAWLIRKAIRENLEFIADDELMNRGADKKQYQYLLLKVTGNNHISTVTPFSFSSLKKRIQMMNAIKSSKIQLLKFTFLLPLLLVVFLAYRKPTPIQITNEAKDYVGLIVDADEPGSIANARAIEINTDIKTISGINEFYSLLNDTITLEALRKIKGKNITEMRDQDDVVIFKLVGGGSIIARKKDVLQIVEEDGKKPMLQATVIPNTTAAKK
ncbi:MAG: M56 family metallopeptidase [Chitinophagaceae bacterium]|nr:M56 family metallopeptidase [Chitinophagaceae bacterium]